MVAKLIRKVAIFLVPILIDAFCMGVKKWMWRRDREQRFLDKDRFQ